MSKPESSYALLPRQAKAAKLALALREHGLHKDAHRLSMADWAEVAKLAKVNPPR